MKLPPAYAVKQIQQVKGCNLLHKYFNGGLKSNPTSRSRPYTYRKLFVKMLNHYTENGICSVYDCYLEFTKITKVYESILCMTSVKNLKFWHINCISAFSQCTDNTKQFMLPSIVNLINRMKIGK